MRSRTARSLCYDYIFIDKGIPHASPCSYAPPGTTLTTRLPSGNITLDTELRYVRMNVAIDKVKDSCDSCVDTTSTDRIFLCLHTQTILLLQVCIMVSQTCDYYLLSKCHPCTRLSRGETDMLWLGLSVTFTLCDSQAVPLHVYIHKLFNKFGAKQTHDSTTSAVWRTREEQKLRSSTAIALYSCGEAHVYICAHTNAPTDLLVIHWRDLVHRNVHLQSCTVVNTHIIIRY